MKNHFKKFVVFLCLVVVAFTCGDVSAAESLGKTERGPAGEKAAAPDFTLETISGKTVSLKDSKGKGTILFFFATWCPYCRRKLPSLSHDYDKYKSEGVELLVIDSGESKEKVSSFAAKQKLPFDILLDKDGKVSGVYDVIGVPTFILISKEGRIVFEDNEMAENYKKLLE